MTDVRARKSGIALEIERKLEEKYDEEDALGTPDKVLEWINTVLKGEHPAATVSKKSPSFRTIHNHLRDGVVLCKLINKLRLAAGLPKVKFSANASTAFVAMANIELFNNSAKEYGLPDEQTFQSIDLYEGRKAMMLNVINCINKLGFKANEKGFTPPYEAVAPPARDADTWAHT